MRQNKKNWKIRVASVGVAVTCLCGGVLAAGDQSDPLISLSYLTKTAIPEILEQVDKQAEKYQTGLLKNFNAAIDEFKGEMRKEQEKGTQSATYDIVVLSQGEKLNLGIGGEVLLRNGSVSISATASSALVDMSGGSTLGDGGKMEENHLYVAAQSDCVITAESADVTLLVRGKNQIL